MSDLDDLLNGEDEFDYEDNEITNEEEEALLQDEDFDGARFPEDEYLESKRVHDSTKKESASETDEPEEDILNLDIEGEEDFQEVEDKAAYDEQTNENRKDGKFSVERAPAAPKMTTTVKVERAQVAKPAEDDTDKDKVQNIKKVPPKIDKRRRGNGRNNFQTRPNFIRNNDRRQERRNSTVFINPKYEGIVHVNDNNARLAWDSTTFPQNRYIQPWVSGNIPRNCDLNFQSGSSLITNLVSELATNISQTSNLFQIPTVPQSQNQNFFQPPPDVYHPPMSFQPPNVQGAQQPYSNQNQHIPHWDDTYNMLNQNQVPNRQTFPSQTSSLQSYHASGSQQYQPLVDRPQNESKPYGSYSNYNYYNRTNNQQNYENRNLNYNKPVIKQNDYEMNKNNFPKPVDFQRDANFMNDGYQKRNPTYNFVKQEYKNQHLDYNATSYNRNLIKNVGGRGHYNNINKTTNLNTYGNKNLVNKECSQQQQGAYCNRVTNLRNTTNQNQSNFYNKTSTQPDSRNPPQRNFVGQKSVTRRPCLNQSVEMKTELPEKKIKTEENTSKVPENSNEESKKPSEPAKSQTAIDEEDEDMRLYRLKIEEQKREREKVLRMKEERRKLMLQQQQQAEEEKSAAADNRQQGATSFAQKNNFPCNNVPVSSVQAQYFGKPQSSADDELASLTFKVPNNLQILQKPAPTAANVQKPEPTSNSFMSNRVVVVKGSNNQKGGALQNSNIVKTVEASHDSADVGQGLSSFFNNRKVLKKDNSLINTRLVIINNLSASTNQNKLVAMTRGIGEIQKLRMDKQERQATILFKSVASAHAFFKKYQRHMLDLSVIDVKLEPML